MQARFGDRGISFRAYPFAAASIGRWGFLASSEIRDVDPNAFPPEIRTHQGETLFVSAEQEGELLEFVELKELSVVQRFDVWDLLLEPYLDTELTWENRKRNRKSLRAIGLSGIETTRIRRKVNSAMWLYNSFAWEWFHLGLYDVLIAMRQPHSFRSLFQRFSHSQNEFYWEAMEIADRGPKRDTQQEKEPP